jgi:hypothetical protein
MRTRCVYLSDALTVGQQHDVVKQLECLGRRLQQAHQHRALQAQANQPPRASPLPPRHCFTPTSYTVSVLPTTPRIPSCPGVKLKGVRDAVQTLDLRDKYDTPNHLVAAAVLSAPERSAAAQKCRRARSPRAASPLPTSRRCTMLAMQRTIW